MSSTIIRFPLSTDTASEQFPPMPKGALVLGAGLDATGALSVWFTAPGSEPAEQDDIPPFFVLRDGEACPDASYHITTVIKDGEVLHVFALPPKSILDAEAKQRAAVEQVRAHIDKLIGERKAKAAAAAADPLEVALAKATNG